MSEFLEPVIEETPAEHLSWIKVWTIAITRPSTKTFERILRDPQAGPRRAYLWITIVVIISSLTSMVTSLVYPSESMRTDISRIILLILPLILGIVQILWISFYVWGRQWIAARFYGGSGTFTSMIYATAAYWAPMSVITIPFTLMVTAGIREMDAIPGLVCVLLLVECLWLMLLVYQHVLGVIAVKAVTRISWAGAVVSYFALPVLVFGIILFVSMCVLILVLIILVFYNPSPDPNFITLSALRRLI